MDAIGFKEVIFLAAAFAAAVSSLLMVTGKNPIHSALWMIVTFFAMAVIYLLLHAEFIAVAQVMVYAGAIMMLILFVIMLVHMEKGEEVDPGKKNRFRKTRVAGILITAVLFAEMSFGSLLYRATGQPGDYPAEMVGRIGNVKTIGALLYGQYLFPSEIASILLLVGIVGAVIIAKGNR
jgi:NADH-quinone oxidoreductase subunit J